MLLIATLAITSTTAAIWTAIGTLTLALITGVSLAFGWNSLRQGQREVEEGHRPVVVPLSESGTLSLVDRENKPWTVQARPWASNDGDNELNIPFENIGPGPGLKLVATVEVPGTDSGLVRSDAVALGSATRLSLRFIVDGLEDASRRDQVPVPDFCITVTYDDVSGKRWMTSGRYAASRKIYEDVSISSIRSRPH
jgi:hypothetical protein